MSRLPRLLAFVLLGTAAALAAGSLGAARERPYDIAVVPRSGTARWLSLGHPTLAANLMWLRAVQYIGEPRANRRGWEKLYPVANLVTDLDPRHGYAYQVAGVMLGSLGRVAESNAILEKGTRALPERYALPLLRAFNAFYYEDDWPAAGRWAEVAARAKGAPPHLRQSVIAYYAKGNRADAAVAFLEEARRTATDDESRKALDEQLARARYESAAGAIDAAVERYRVRNGIGPLWIARLVDDGYLPRLPDDPYGGRWTLDGDGLAASTAGPPRYRRPARNELGREPGVGRSTP